jgi:hypothetical protein
MAAAAGGRAAVDGPVWGDRVSLFREEREKGFVVVGLCVCPRAQRALEGKESQK